MSRSPAYYVLAILLYAVMFLSTAWLWQGAWGVFVTHIPGVTEISLSESSYLLFCAIVFFSIAQRGAGK